MRKLGPVLISLALLSAAPPDSGADQTLFEEFQKARQDEIPSVEGKPVQAPGVLDLAASRIRRMPLKGNSRAKALTLNTLTYMAKTIRWHGDISASARRDPHEWSGPRVVANGNFNGCVEAAKAFMSLYTAADPPSPPLLVGGTLKGEDGGHAVVEVVDERGGAFLVDTAMFQLLVPRLSERNAANPKGITLQTGKEDIHIRKTDRGFDLTRYEFRHLFWEDKRIGDPIELRDLAQVNAWLRENAVHMHSFEDLEKAHIVIYEDNGRFSGPGGKQYHIYQKTAGEPFNGTDKERVASGQRALEDAVKNGAR